MADRTRCPPRLLAGIAALLLTAPTGCGPTHVALDAATDALPPADGRGDASAPVDFMVTVTLGDGRPVEGARVYAERAGDAPVEAVTDGMGEAHLWLSLSGRPWDVTATKDDYVIASVMGVDGPLEHPLVLIAPRAPNPTRLPLSGTVHGRLDPVHSLGVSPRIGEPGDVDVLQEHFECVYYTRSVTTDFETPPLRVAAVEYDSTGRVFNGALSDELPRTGTPITDVVINLPLKPRAVQRATAMVHYPGEGILAPIGTITVAGALVGEVLGSNPVWLLGITVGFEPPIEGRTRWHVEYFDGDMAPNRFMAQLLVINNGSWLVELSRTSMHDGDVVRLPVIRALGVPGNSLSEAALEVDAEGAVSAMFQVGDASGLPAWYGYLQHPDRAAARRLPRLPPGVSLRKRFGDEMQIQALTAFGTTSDMALPYPFAAPEVLVVSTPTPISTEGR